MEQVLDGGGIDRLEKYFREIGDVLNEDRRRASFAMYAMGLFGEGDRKSVEPIAARACGDPEETERAHDRLLHFMTDSRWSDRGVRREGGRARALVANRRSTCRASAPTRWSSGSSAPGTSSRATRRPP